MSQAEACALLAIIKERHPHVHVQIRAIEDGHAWACYMQTSGRYVWDRDDWNRWANPLARPVEQEEVEV